MLAKKDSHSFHQNLDLKIGSELKKKISHRKYSLTQQLVHFWNSFTRKCTHGKLSLKAYRYICGLLDESGIDRRSERPPGPEALRSLKIAGDENVLGGRQQASEAVQR